MLVASAFQLSEYRNALLDDRKTDTRHLVETAHGILEHFHDRVRSGELSEDQGRQAAARTLEALLRPAPASPRSPANYRPTGDGMTRVQHLARYVASTPEGRRNDALFWACCTAYREGYPAEAFHALHDAAVAAGLSEVEISRTLTSAQRAVGGAA